jgi:hypothetical protein
MERCSGFTMGDSRGAWMESDEDASDEVDTPKAGAFVFGERICPKLSLLEVNTGDDGDLVNFSPIGLVRAEAPSEDGGGEIG